MTAMTATTTQVHRIYIRASAQAIWDAITSPEWAVKYGYQAPVEYDLRPGGRFRGLASEAMREHGAPEEIIDGEVLETDPPHRLVQTWHASFAPDLAAEPATRLTYEISESDEGISCLTVTHELEGAPAHAVAVGGEHPEYGGGWMMILSDLKSLLETGRAMT